MSYTVEHEEGCRIIRGVITLSDLASLLNTWSERDERELYADAALANKLGAVIVIGSREMLNRWKLTLWAQEPWTRQRPDESEKRRE